MVGQRADRNDDIFQGKMGRTSMAFRLTDGSMISDLVESQRVSGDEQGLTPSHSPNHWRRTRLMPTCANYLYFA
jgi:hypothetical protein